MVNPKSDDMELILVLDPKTYKFGFKNSQGKLVVPYVYEKAAHEWSDGMIYVKRGTWQGFLDSEADEPICLSGYYVPDSATPSFKNGLCMLQKKDALGIVKWGCIDKQGVERIPFVYDSLVLLGGEEENIYCARRKDCRELVSSKGVLTDLTHFDEMGMCMYGDLLPVAACGKYGLKYWGCVDINGTMHIPIEYDSIECIDRGLFKVEKNGKFGVLNDCATEVVPIQYDAIKTFNSGLCAVQASQVWGYVNKAGAVVIPMQYMGATNFHDGYALVKPGEKFNMIDTSGRMIAGTEYDDVRDFSEGLCAVKKKKSWGFVDTTYKLVIPCLYADVEEFHDGKCRVKRHGAVLSSDNPWGVIDRNNNMIVPWTNKLSENTEKTIETLQKIGVVLKFLAGR